MTLELHGCEAGGELLRSSPGNHSVADRLQNHVLPFLSHTLAFGRSGRPGLEHP